MEEQKLNLLIGLGSYEIPFVGSVYAELTIADDEQPYELPLTKLNGYTKEQAKEWFNKFIDTYFAKIATETNANV